MIEAPQVPCLRHHRRCRHELHATHGLEGGHHRRHRPGRNDLLQRCVKSIDPLSRGANRVQHLLKGQALCRMREVLPVQPAQVAAFPAGFPLVETPVPKQERGDVLAFAPIIRDRHRARPHQIPHRLVRLVRHPNLRQFPRSEQPRQRLRIPPVGLDPIARPARDQRGGDHSALVPEGQNLPIQPVSRRTCLIAKMQHFVAIAQLPHQSGHRLGGGIELAEIPDLSVPTALRNRHRVSGFRGIDPNERLPM
jgi:hypothetical protein